MITDAPVRYPVSLDGRDGAYGPMAVVDHAGTRYSPRFPDLRTRGTICFLVVAAHLALGWFIARSPLSLARSASRTEPLVMISLVPHQEAPITLMMPARLLSVDRVDAEPPVLRDIEVEETPAGMAGHSGSTIPPHPNGEPIDTLPFARQAGLPQRAGATVVLRVQVLGNGAVGQVLVDVSGGSSQIDQAAVAYVRALKWLGGRIDDKPETLWIRWGVRLDG